MKHIASGTIIFHAKPGLTIDELSTSPLRGALALGKWLWNGAGPFGRMGVSSVAFVRSDDVR